MGKLVDISGLKFGELLVIRKSEIKKPSGALWECICSCGNTSTVNTIKLRTGLAKSCGCRQNSGLSNYKHGHGTARTRTYRSWKELRQRCNNPNSDKWKWYGGRGINVCERWDDFRNFLEDMGERPQGKTIDRISSDGNYSPENCKWSTPKEQAKTNRGVFKKGAVPHNKKITSP